MSPRRVIEVIRPASFVRRSHWYWRLVRDLQTKDWGYRKPINTGCNTNPTAHSLTSCDHPTAQQWLDGARELEQLADEAERIARERVESDQGTIPTGRGYPTTLPE